MQGGVGGAMMASLMARRLIIRKLNLNVNGALSFGVWWGGELAVTQRARLGFSDGAGVENCW